MKFSIAALLSTVALATAQRTYNITSAFAPGNIEKYKCLTTEKWIKDFQIPDCLAKCTREANSKDGCAYDDFACHNINYQAYSDIIEPCAFPPQLGGHGTCTTAELMAVRPKVAAAGNFFNATLYTAYAGRGCHVRLSVKKTLKIVRNEATVVST